jgi:hypothetical protein
MHAHIFIDDQSRIVAVMDKPDAIDHAPYDRMVERRCKVDFGLAILATLAVGGVVVTESGLIAFPGDGAKSSYTPHPPAASA